MRLLSSREFMEVRKKGRRSFSRSFIVYTLANGLETNRLGITASARVGGAVQRNRVKRLIREFFRLNRQRISPGRSIDIAVYVKRNTDIKSMSLSSVEEELGRILIKKEKNP
jgi:ribonuclease P protein component